MWLIDPDAKQVEVYETIRGRATFAIAAATKSKLPPFDHAFDVETWFAAPKKPAAKKRRRSTAGR